MLLMQQRILRDGVVRDGNILAVDSFLNHQMDPELYQEMGREFYRLFGGCGVTKILTVEASGIGIAAIAARRTGSGPKPLARVVSRCSTVYPIAKTPPRLFLSLKKDGISIAAEGTNHKACNSSGFLL